MREKKSQSFGIIATAILGILTLLAFVFQVTSLNNATSKLETTLFNILEFVLSLGFGWVLTRMVTQEEFEKSLKRFALSAYRRIVDIERATNRLKDAVETMRKRHPPDSYCELDIVHAVVVNTRQTLKSATADWADVIGEELATLKKIQDLEEKKEEILVQEPVAAGQEQLEELQRQITELIIALPFSLRYEATKESTFDIDEAADLLREKHLKQKGLRLKAFWDPAFEHDPQDLKPGDKVRVATDDVADRVGCLTVKDQGERSVGVVTNPLPGLLFKRSSYPDFVTAVQRAFGKSHYSAEIVSIDEELSSGERRYFHIRILDRIELG